MLLTITSGQLPLLQRTNISGLNILNAILKIALCHQNGLSGQSNDKVFTIVLFRNPKLCQQTWILC